jgi:hypothetical protein
MERKSVIIKSKYNQQLGAPSKFDSDKDESPADAASLNSKKSSNGGVPESLSEKINKKKPLALNQMLPPKTVVNTK